MSIALSHIESEHQCQHYAGSLRRCPEHGEARLAVPSVGTAEHDALVAEIAAAQHTLRWTTSEPSPHNTWVCVTCGESGEACDNSARRHTVEAMLEVLIAAAEE